MLPAIVTIESNDKNICSGVFGSARIGRVQGKLLVHGAVFIITVESHSLGDLILLILKGGQSGNALRCANAIFVTGAVENSSK